jgi:hypothetical protein
MANGCRDKLRLVSPLKRVMHAVLSPIKAGSDDTNRSNLSLCHNGWHSVLTAMITVYSSLTIDTSIIAIVVISDKQLHLTVSAEVVALSISLMLLILMLALPLKLTWRDHARYQSIVAVGMPWPVCLSLLVTAVRLSLLTVAEVTSAGYSVAFYYCCVCSQHH